MQNRECPEGVVGGVPQAAIAMQPVALAQAQAVPVQAVPIQTVAMPVVVVQADA
jgi:hypothetical protein